jgi:hypothetical protein
MTVTIRSQQESRIFMSNKEIRNRTRFIKKAVENQEDICSNCNDCKQAILLPNGVYCGKIRDQPSNMSECSFFDPEPIEYRLFRRT